MRTIPVPLRTIIPTFACAVLVGCGGSVASTNDSNGNTPGANTDSGTDAGPRADSAINNNDARVDDSLSTNCDGVEGLTGQSVLDALNVPNDGGVFSRWAPSGPPNKEGDTPLTLHIRYTGGMAKCTPAQPDPPGTFNPGVTPARVSVEVNVEFVTADGLFNEQMKGQLSTSSVRTPSVHLEATIPASEIIGQYRTMAQSGRLGENAPITFFGLFTGEKGGTYGGVVYGGVGGDPVGGFEFH